MMTSRENNDHRSNQCTQLKQLRKKQMNSAVLAFKRIGQNVAAELHKKITKRTLPKRILPSTSPQMSICLAPPKSNFIAMGRAIWACALGGSQ